MRGEIDDLMLNAELAELLVEACAERDICVQALGLALGALQTIRSMEPITHEITLPTVMAQHAVDALSDIKALVRSP